MNRLAIALSSLALFLSFAAACSSSSASDGGDGGALASSDGTKLSCLVQLSGFEPQCQLYEATGTDAAKTVDQVRAGCIDQGGAKASVLAVCPSADVLGGCRKPVPVKGSTEVQLFITTFEYKPTLDASSPATHKTAEEVKTFCAVAANGEATYVASP